MQALLTINPPQRASKSSTLRARAAEQVGPPERLQNSDKLAFRSFPHPLLRCSAGKARLPATLPTLRLSVGTHHEAKKSVGWARSGRSGRALGQRRVFTPTQSRQQA